MGSEELVERQEAMMTPSRRVPFLSFSVTATSGLRTCAIRAAASDAVSSGAAGGDGRRSRVSRGGEQRAEDQQRCERRQFGEGFTE